MKKRKLTREQVIERAKDAAPAWNAFREMMPNNYRWEELVNAAKDLNLYYTQLVLSQMKKENILISPERGLWFFAKDKPIHYSLIVKCIEYRREAGARRRKSTELNKPQDINLVDLSGYTAGQLVEELRSRGFIVKASKTIEL